MTFRLSTAGAPAWKLGLIPVLMDVLFMVTRTSTTDADPGVDVVSRRATSEPVVVAPAQKTTVLPELTLDDALTFNPFAPLPLLEHAPDEPVVVAEPPVVPADPQPAPPAG